MTMNFATTAAATLSLLLVCACQSSQPVSHDKRASQQYSGPMDYSVARPRDVAGLENATLVADFTLIDLDDVVADEKLQRKSNTDIRPRVYGDAVGEWWAAYALAEGVGEVAGRFSLAPQIGKATEFHAMREHFYLEYWVDQTPQVRVLEHGAAGKLTVNQQADGTFNVQVDTESQQLAWPVRTFLVGGGVKWQSANVPEIFRQQRLAAQAVKPGETAVFQLGSAPFENSHRTRLLCLRLEVR